MISGGLAFVLAILFMTVVAPVWIISHYVTKWRTSRGLSAQDERTLAELWESAQRMENRIQSLEKVLDSEAPNWRARVSP